MGIMPAPMASVVMMMGRARLWQASSAHAAAMLAARHDGVFHQQDGVLGGDAHQHDEPDEDGMESSAGDEQRHEGPPSDSGSAARMVTAAGSP
jgi:hypothetical protein